MVHASVRAVGWIVGGPDALLRALSDVLGPAGTVCMYVGWADSTSDLASWPLARQRAYLEECPTFDPARSRAASRDCGVLTETLRTTPGATRSAHPDASVAAVGAKAEWLTSNHPLQYGFGPGSPFERIIDARGDVLLLGSPRGAVTLLHSSEHLVRLPNKRTVVYRSPILVDGERRWFEMEESRHRARHRPDPPRGDYFADLVDDYLARGYGRFWLWFGAARSHLFDAADLNACAVKWMEDNLSVSSLQVSP